MSFGCFPSWAFASCRCSEAMRSTFPSCSPRICEAPERRFATTSPAFVAAVGPAALGQLTQQSLRRLRRADASGGHGDVRDLLDRHSRTAVRAGDEGQAVAGVGTGDWGRGLRLSMSIASESPFATPNLKAPTAVPSPEPPALSPRPHRVVIVGGGFAGLNAARRCVAPPSK